MPWWGRRTRAGKESFWRCFTSQNFFASLDKLIIRRTINALFRNNIRKECSQTVQISLLRYVQPFSLPGKRSHGWKGRMSYLQLAMQVLSAVKTNTLELEPVKETKPTVRLVLIMGLTRNHSISGSCYVLNEVMLLGKQWERAGREERAVYKVFHTEHPSCLFL